MQIKNFYKIKNCLYRQKNKVYFFGLTEALIVMASISLLSLLVILSMKHLSSSGGTVQCSESLRMLARANILYATEFKRFVPAAIGDSYRWYGVKEQKGAEPHFELYTSPLFTYLEGYKRIDMCPALEGMLSPNLPIYDDRGGFGYGYNENISSLRYTSMVNFWEAPCQKWGLEIKKIKEPDKTVMFTDTATKVDLDGRTYIGGRIAEFGFARSYFLINAGAPLWGVQDPTIHFRHEGKANVAWGDNHVSPEVMTFSKDDWGKSMIGFFGPADNSLFDPN